MKTTLLLSLCGLALSPVLAAQECASAETHTVSLRGDTASKDSILATARKAGSFETLAAAVEAAGLTETLEGKGPFTVLAPTDQAFAKLDPKTLKTLLLPKNKELLRSILLYHVVPGNVKAGQVVKLKWAETANGQRVDIRVDEGKVFLDGARVTSTDIVCSNGTIHVLDTVILPSTKDVVETAIEAGSFDTLVTAVKAAGLVEALRAEGPITVFAPTDEAFAKLPEGTLASLLQEENRDKLASILTYHVVAGRVYSDQAVKLDEATTLQGGKLRIRSDAKGVRIGDARVVKADLETSNGVIHVIDRVLIP